MRTTAPSSTSRPTTHKSSTRTWIRTRIRRSTRASSRRRTSRRSRPHRTSERETAEAPPAGVGTPGGLAIRSSMDGVSGPGPDGKRSPDMSTTAIQAPSKFQKFVAKYREDHQHPVNHVLHVFVGWPMVAAALLLLPLQAAVVAALLLRRLRRDVQRPLRVREEHPDCPQAPEHPLRDGLAGHQPNSPRARSGSWAARRGVRKRASALFSGNLLRVRDRRDRPRLDPDSREQAPAG